MGISLRPILSALEEWNGGRNRRDKEPKIEREVSDWRKWKKLGDFLYYRKKVAEYIEGVQKLNLDYDIHTTNTNLRLIYDLLSKRIRIEVENKEKKNIGKRTFKHHHLP